MRYMSDLRHALSRMAQVNGATIILLLKRTMSLIAEYSML